LKNKDLLTLDPWLLRKSERQYGRLATTRRSLQQRYSVFSDPRQDRFKMLLYRKLRPIAAQ
jgi:hypothetical protein